LSNNQGFRSGKSVHSSLTEIKFYWGDVDWFIKFEIKKTFDKTNHHRLFSLLGRHVLDKKVQDELYKMLNVKEINWKIFSKGFAVPQGSVLFPFLYNVYMHDLDVQVTKLIKKKERKLVKVENHEYVSERQKLYKQLITECKGIRSRLRATVVLRKKFKIKGIPLFTYQISPIHINYVRYVNDFLFGVTADKSIAKIVQKNINAFIQSILYLDIFKEYFKHA